MMIVEPRLLTADARISTALNATGQYPFVLAKMGHELRLFRATVLDRPHEPDQTLADLPWWASGHVPTMWTPSESLTADLRAHSHSTEVREFIAKADRPLGALALGGPDRYVLVSGSESFLMVNYHCTRPPKGHPFYPPPPWGEGMRCWCHYEIVEG
jgi:hypothetical protein